MIRSLLTLAAVSLLFAWSPTALAQDVRFFGTDGYHVRAMIHSATGGQVRIEAATIVSTGNVQDQDLLLGQGFEATLRPGETRMVTLRAFCLHPDRGTATGPMLSRGQARGELASLVALRGRVTDDHLQQAIWAVRGRPTADPDVIKVLLLAGVVPKPGVTIPARPEH